MTNLLALPGGTTLVGDYKIARVLGAGGFGITYLADELALDRRVTIKEYFPSDFAARKGAVDASPRSKECSPDYKWGLERFIEEAQVLARFDHPNIVRVFRYFRANNTGYMVLQFEEGQSFKSWLKARKRPPRQDELDAIVAPLLDALEMIHRGDFLHRDIAPDNIIIRKDGSPVLIDFGSARGEIATQSRTVSALVKPGYSPYEQYATSSRNQGPWTDIYALGATLYQAVTGERPPDAPSRMVKDEYVTATKAAKGSFRPSFLSAIDTALALDVEQRPQTISTWRNALFDGEAPAANTTARAGQATRRTERAETAGDAAQSKPTSPSTPTSRGGLGYGPMIDAPTAPAAAVAALQPIPNLPVPVDGPRGDKRAGLARRLAPFQWRGLAVKFLIGLSVAGLAVSYQAQLKHLAERDAATLTTTAPSSAPSDLAVTDRTPPPPARD
jgi:serine/threonine protein kinase